VAILLNLVKLPYIVSPTVCNYNRTCMCDVDAGRTWESLTVTNGVGHLISHTKMLAKECCKHRWVYSPCEMLGH